jgi:hypothetical protein
MSAIERRSACIERPQALALMLVSEQTLSTRPRRKQAPERPTSGCGSPSRRSVLAALRPRRTYRGLLALAAATAACGSESSATPAICSGVTTTSASSRRARSSWRSNALKIAARAACKASRCSALHGLAKASCSRSVTAPSATGAWIITKALAASISASMVTNKAGVRVELVVGRHKELSRSVVVPLEARGDAVKHVDQLTARVLNAFEVVRTNPVPTLVLAAEMALHEGQADGCGQGNDPAGKYQPDLHQAAVDRRLDRAIRGRRSEARAKPIIVPPTIEPA